MDLFTHLCLPVAAVYVTRPDLFESPLAFGLAGFAVFPDVDKLVSVPGGLHSLVTLVPVAGVVLFVEWVHRRKLRVAPVAVALLYSHLLLDVVDGNLVPLLAPLYDWGVGLHYPGRVVFGGTWPVWFRGDAVKMVLTVPSGGGGGSGVTTYQFLGEAGVLSVLFLALLVSPLARGPDVTGRDGT